MKTLHGVLALAAATLIPLAPAQVSAVEAKQAVVLGVHGAEASRSFVTERGIPPGSPEGGRYAAVRLIQGAWGDASFALVYVPPHLAVSRNDVVELAATGADILAHPGTGVVARVSRHGEAEKY